MGQQKAAVKAFTPLYSHRCKEMYRCEYYPSASMKIRILLCIARISLLRFLVMSALCVHRLLYMM